LADVSCRVHRAQRHCATREQNLGSASPVSKSIRHVTRCFLSFSTTPRWRPVKYGKPRLLR
jgi:hypothetical protein